MGDRDDGSPQMTAASLPASNGRPSGAHTKGPWLNLGLLPSGAWPITAQGDGHDIGEIWIGNPNAQMDACLVAASPDILESLKEAVHALSNAVHPDCWRDFDDLKIWAEDMFLPAARRALSKAAATEVTPNTRAESVVVNNALIVECEKELTEARRAVLAAHHRESFWRERIKAAKYLLAGHADRLAHGAPVGSAPPENKEGSK